ncbi:zinc finger protein 347-like [Scylla paramamosain]|uniref:zinc finger protein 347-like n=1 Tax=Scylla paramamosain TaxID=85552 RepID=UPI00308278AB
MALSETWVQFVMAATLPCSTDQASIQAASLPGTDGCLASLRVPAGLDTACAGRRGAAVEVVRPGSSMSGQQRRQQRQQQQQPASGVGRHRCGGKNHLEAGSSVHRGESKFECQQCDKTFLSRQGLDYHTLTHRGVRNYECGECHKKFTTKSHLTRHTLTHSGVRNYECDECSKKFTTKCHLTRHTLTHSGVRNCECDECGKKFTRKSSLNTHTLTHSGVKNYKCDECQAEPRLHALLTANQSCVRLPRGSLQIWLRRVLARVVLWGRL